jgi:hypothetical protein
MTTTIGDAVEEAFDHAQDEGYFLGMAPDKIIEAREHVRLQVEQRIKVIRLPDKESDAREEEGPGASG